jgi:hypothetical protein
MRILSVRKVAHAFKKNEFAFWELFTAANDRRQCRRHRERSVLAQTLTCLTTDWPTSSCERKRADEISSVGGVDQENRCLRARAQGSNDRNEWLS